MKVVIRRTELWPVWELEPATSFDREEDVVDVSDELIARLAAAEREYYETLEL